MKKFKKLLPVAESNHKYDYPLAFYVPCNYNFSEPNDGIITVGVEYRVYADEAAYVANGASIGGHHKTFTLPADDLTTVQDGLDVVSVEIIDDPSMI